MARALKRMSLAVFMAMTVICPAHAETFDPAALSAAIAKLALEGYGTPDVVTLGKNNGAYDLDHEFELGLRAIVTFQENVADNPKTLSYFVFDSPKSMQAGIEDFVLDMSQFSPDGLQVEEGWGSYGYTGNEPSARQEHFDCTNSRDTSSKLINANCGDFSGGRQTVVLASLVGWEGGTNVPVDLAYAGILSEVHLGLLGLAKAEAALQQPKVDQGSVSAMIDPVLVGNWETYVPFGNGWSLFRLEITGAARYAFFQDGVAGHSGKFETKDGQWQMISETDGWRDFGTYHTPDATTFNMKSQLGPSTWRKVGP